MMVLTPFLPPRPLLPPQAPPPTTGPSSHHRPLRGPQVSLSLSTWGQKAALHSQCSLPQEAHVPDGLILQLWPKQGVQLG